MAEHAEDRLITAHEQRMAGIELWCGKLEKKVDKIPWILLGVACTFALSLFNVILTIFINKI